VHPDNPLQQPFVCTTEQAGLGSPVVDNHTGLGFPVAEGGYSQFCGAPMQLSYFYRTTHDTFRSLPQGDYPADGAYLQRNGREMPFIVRLERGVINRFIYATTMLVGADEQPRQPDISQWNRQLVMFFNGGIGIGHKQAGRQALKTVGRNTHRDPYLFSAGLLAQGYAITTSSGMTTDTSYHLPLLAQTAQMVKQQFVARYGKPQFSYALGGSGGAIQALYNSTRYPQLLDGLLMTHLFPDLLTQINGVGDCELLEYYFDRGHMENGRADPFWADWANRSMIEGFNAVNNYPKIRTDVAGTGRPLMSTAQRGGSTCTEGWRISVPVFFNPRFLLPFVDNQQAWLEQDPDLLSRTRWSHWDDARDLYGVTESGFAGRTYDNEGVQYGLQALRDGRLDIDRFLHLNARVGGWLPPEQMQREAAPYYPYGLFGIGDAGFWNFLQVNLAFGSLGDLLEGGLNLLDQARGRVPEWLADTFGSDSRQSVWSHYNATAWRSAGIAPRSLADSTALRNAEQQQLIFRGELRKPAITLVQYLDDRLDIHDARQAFLTRQRVQQAGNDPQLMSIWGMLLAPGEKLPEAVTERLVLDGLASLQRWLETGVRPLQASDRCWDAQQQLIAEGDSVWQGIERSDTMKGACARHFPLHGNARTVAGDSFRADTLKCSLQSIEAAQAAGVWGDVQFSPAQLAQLQQIFPDGVCDYDQPGVELH